MDSFKNTKPGDVAPEVKLEPLEGLSGSIPAANVPSSLEPPVLSYNPKKLRILLTFTQKHCAESPSPPPEMTARARVKMLEVERSGKVILFTIYEQRLERAWAKLREHRASDAPDSITIVLAAGAPPLSGLEIKPPLDDDSLAILSINADANEVAAWQLDWLKLHLQRALRERGINKRLNATQIHGALGRARAGQRVQDLAIKGIKRSRPKDRRPFHLAINRARKEISLVIFDLSLVSNLRRVEERIVGIEEAIGKLAGFKKGAYRVLRQELLESIEAGLCGPERLGLDLPLVLLAAIDPTPTTYASINEAPSPRRLDLGDRGQSFPHLTVAISDDRMTANITAFSPGLPRAATKLTEEWLHGELERAGVIFGTRVGLLDDIKKIVAADLDFRGLVVALGLPAAAGQGPYLHLVTQEQDEQPGDGLRAYRRHSLAKAGQLIAEVRFMDPPVVGKEVTGRDVSPPTGETMPDPLLGEGIEKRGTGRFYAMLSGVVGYDGNGALSLTKVLVHEGNANLASGDIVFDGPAEIKGNIDSGANVKVRGDLLVRGEICGGKIECGGNITVGRGIVVGQGGSVRARGDINADFVENSKVTCGGSLTVARSIMQSNIMVGGVITVTGTDGLIGGGSYVCGNMLKTKNLGLPDGSRTEVSAGVNFQAELSAHLRQGRLMALVKQSEEERRVFRDLMKKPPAKLSKSEKDAKDKLRDRITRWGGLIEAARLHLEKVSTRLTYDNEACIYVTGKLAINCEIRLGGKVIPIFRETTSVMITTVEAEGSFLRPYSGDGPKAQGKAEKG